MFRAGDCVRKKTAWQNGGSGDRGGGAAGDSPLKCVSISKFSPSGENLAPPPAVRQLL